MKHIRLKLNVALGKDKVGDIVRIKCDDKGVPLEVYWRRRLKEAVSNNCVEVMQESVANSSSKSKTK